MRLLWSVLDEGKKDAYSFLMDIVYSRVIIFVLLFIKSVGACLDEELIWIETPQK